MMAAVLVGLAAAATATGLAQAPTPTLRISGAFVYKPHELVRLAAEGVPDKAGVRWRVNPSANVQRATTARNLLEFAAPPGSYEVELLTVRLGAGQEILLEEAFATVVVESCHPPIPPPNPTPPQPDPPTPNPPKPGGGRLDPENAIGRIQFGSAGCSATVIHPRRPDGRWDVLTAAHCISKAGQTGTITMPASGKKYGVKVVVFDRTADLCWLVTTESIDDIEYAHLSRTVPSNGSPVWHRGYGVDRPRNKESGTLDAQANGQGQLRFTLNVSSGDSGGGIFRADTNEVISSVCCTMGKGAKVSMWGGACPKAWSMRPAPSAEEMAWSPQAIPTVPGGDVAPDDWQPVEIPVVQPDVPQAFPAFPERPPVMGWR